MRSKDMAMAAVNNVQGIRSRIANKQDVIKPGSAPVFHRQSPMSPDKSVSEKVRMFEQLQQNANAPANGARSYPAALPAGANNVRGLISMFERVAPNASNVPQQQNPPQFASHTPHAVPNASGYSQAQPSAQPFASARPSNNAQLVPNPSPFNNIPLYNNPIPNSHEAQFNRLASVRPHQVINVPFNTPLGMRVNESGATILPGYHSPNDVNLTQFPVGITSLGIWPYRSQNAPGATAQPAPENQGNFPIINMRF